MNNSAKYKSLYDVSLIKKTKRPIELSLELSNDLRRQHGKKVAVAILKKALKLLGE